jgi:hypothetical protein
MDALAPTGLFLFASLLEPAAPALGMSPDRMPNSLFTACVYSCVCVYVCVCVRECVL